MDDLYFYDGEGRRIKKINGSISTIFMYNAASQLVAEYSDQTSSQTGGTNYFTQDHLGSPRVITNSQGEVVSRHDYMPFGEEIKAGTGGRTSGQRYVEDNIRQQFTGYVGARDKKVYIYDGSGTRATFPLKQFLSVGKK